jgi:hypothetical protein
MDCLNSPNLSVSNLPESDDHHRNEEQGRCEQATKIPYPWFIVEHASINLESCILHGSTAFMREFRIC